MYRKPASGWLKHADFIVLDLLCLHLSFLAAFFIRHGLRNPYASEMYRSVAFTTVLMGTVVAIFFESFKNVLKRGYYREFVMTMKQVCLVELLLTFYLFTVQRGAEFSRLTLYFMGILYLLSSFIVRVAWKLRLKKRMLDGGKRSLLIVTEESMVKEVVANIRNHNYEMFQIAGIAVLNRDMCGKVIDGVRVVACRDTVIDYACREWVDEVFVNFPQGAPCPEHLINQLTEMGVTVHLKLAQSGSLAGQKRFVERIGNYTVLTTSISCASVGNIFVKRLLDILGGVVGCLITAILFVVLAPVIYLQSPGPIFFSQTRVGRNGKKFKIYKFRSMYMDAEERKKELMLQNRSKDGLMFKLEYDPRIIGSRRLADGTVKKGIGNLIRDWSLDEFPQFFNVLMGDMSLVGTRPPTVDEWERYELRHRARLAIKPGITGLWQVSGRSNIVDFEEVVELDRNYIADWSIGMDIKILLKTIAVVMQREGAM